VFDTYQRVETHILNPKAVKGAELYGDVNFLTQEWTDGLVPCLMRECLQDTSKTRHWIVFDGPVDAIWIENMNTVLDDNMMLCLSNGERIKLKVEMRMLFEVQDLAVASPATVSRCGMVYITTAATGWRPYVQSWLKLFYPDQLPEKPRAHIMALFEKFFPDALAFKMRECKEPIAMTEVAVSTSICQLFAALFNPTRQDFAATNDEVIQHLNMCFIFAFAWSFGGSLDAETAVKMNAFLTDKKKGFQDNKPPGNLFEYWIEPKSRTWKSWEDIVPAFQYSASTPYFDMLVPTIDTVRYSYLAEALLEINRSVFYTGTGVAVCKACARMGVCV
jgi:dynein heavy chain